MQQVWFTIENSDGWSYASLDDEFIADAGYATEYDEYGDAALVAKGLGNCVVIKHWRIGTGIENTEVAGDF